MAEFDVTRESCDACLCVTSRPAFLVNDDHGQYLCVPCQRKYARIRKMLATRSARRALEAADG
jgi:hypothetical protein